MKSSGRSVLLPIVLAVLVLFTVADAFSAWAQSTHQGCSSESNGAFKSDSREASVPEGMPGKRIRPGMGIAVAGGGPWDYPLEMPPITLQIHAVRVQDDNGGRPAGITVAQAQTWISHANSIFSAANISFVLGGFQVVNSTILNNIGDWIDSAQWTELQPILDSHPNEVVVVFRYGPGASPWGNGFSGAYAGVVMMPGFDATYVCNEQNIGLLAHEIGHYLGLSHTHRQRYSTIAEAQAAFAGDAAVFDGDGLRQSHPDPFVDQWDTQCGSTNVLNLGGTSFILPKDNVMSYYHPITTLTPSQAWSARQGAALHSGQDLCGIITSSNCANATLIEAEDYYSSAVVTGGDAFAWMGLWVRGVWSNGYLLRWTDAWPGHQMTIDLSVDSGRYRAFASFGAGEDHGIFDHDIDGQIGNGVSPDLYQGDDIMPTGPVYLGVFDISTDDPWLFEQNGGNILASGPPYSLALDYLLFTPAPIITVDRPNALDVWVIGTWRSVLWSNSEEMSHVKIELSRNGEPFDTLVSSTNNDGHRMVFVPGPATEYAVIRVSDASDPAVFADSYLFEIRDPDTTPPEGSFNFSPQLPHRIGSHPTIQVEASDWWSGIDTGSVTFRLDGISIVPTSLEWGSFCLWQSPWDPDPCTEVDGWTGMFDLDRAVFPGGSYLLEATFSDLAGNPATISIGVWMDPVM